MQDRPDTPATALWHAAFSGDLVTAKRLIVEGVDVNVWDKHGRSPLAFASMAGNLDMVRLLVGSGAWVEPFEEDSVYMTPLMVAAEEGHLDVAEFLLDHGADPTRRGGWSLCCAEYYARHQHPYLAAILARAEDQRRRASRE